MNPLVKAEPYPKTLKRIAPLRVAALVMQIEVLDVSGGIYIYAFCLFCFDSLYSAAWGNLP